MFYNKKLYKSEQWVEFTKKIKTRDNFSCLKCGKNLTNSVLQVHHTIYIVNKKPWEYPESSCITLCKGCHAITHNKIEPKSGWELISIEDLGSNDGICEKKGCNKSIRYLHEIYHPNWGYKTVGSTCVEYLTEEDKFIGKETIKILKKINEVFFSVRWYNAITKTNTRYIGCEFKKSEIRIYEYKSGCSIQTCIKNKGVKIRDFSKIRFFKKIDLNKAKEIGVIILLGRLTFNEFEKEILRKIFLSTNKIN